MKIRTDEQEQDVRDRKELEETLRDRAESMAPERLKNLQDTAYDASKRVPYEGNDFYLVLVKTNQQDALRKPLDRIFARLSCPSPGYNQDVFKYHNQTGTLEYLWSIPRKHRYWKIYNDLPKYLQNKETRRLASFVASMESGQLLEWIKKENGEKPDAVIMLNPKDAEA